MLVRRGDHAGLPEDFAAARPPTGAWRPPSSTRSSHRAFRTGLPAPVFIQQAALLQPPYFGVVDAQRADGQQHLIHEFNRQLSAAVSRRRGAFVWDFEALARTVGSDSLLDPKLWYTSRNPFKQSAYPVLVNDLMRYVLSAIGRVKKCIAVDLDNTLWGGVVGEDGLEGIKLGQTYPGNCYLDLQKDLLKLHQRGVLLAINSKNNEDDALRVIDEHPDICAASISPPRGSTGGTSFEPGDRCRT